MIIEEKDVGRYIFVFDVNNATPIEPKKYRNHLYFIEPNWDEEMQGRWFLSDKSEEIIDPVIIDQFRKINDWLSLHTRAYRLVCSSLNNPYYDRIVVVAAYVPSELAALFRLFWY